MQNDEKVKKCNGEKKKMVYNAKEAKEVESNGLPVDTILDGKITKIEDGVVKDFVKNTDAWDNSDSAAINVTVEVKNPVTQAAFNIHKLFTYTMEEQQMTYHVKSNLGKYKAKYGKLPEVGDDVKIITDSDGFGNIKIK